MVILNICNKLLISYIQFFFSCFECFEFIIIVTLIIILYKSVPYFVGFTHVTCSISIFRIRWLRGLNIAIKYRDMHARWQIRYQLFYFKSDMVCLLHMSFTHYRMQIYEYGCHFKWHYCIILVINAHAKWTKQQQKVIFHST